MSESHSTDDPYAERILDVAIAAAEPSDSDDERSAMTTPRVTPATPPVLTSGERVQGQMYYVPDDLFVICTGVSSKCVASIIHPMIGSMSVPCATLREVHYV